MRNERKEINSNSNLMHVKSSKSTYNYIWWAVCLVYLHMTSSEEKHSAAKNKVRKTNISTKINGTNRCAPMFTVKSMHRCENVTIGAMQQNIYTYIRSSTSVCVCNRCAPQKINRLSLQRKLNTTDERMRENRIAMLYYMCKSETPQIKRKHSCALCFVEVHVLSLL